MNYRTVLVAAIFSSLALAGSYADTGWIGSGPTTSGSNPTVATVKWVKQDATGWAKFKINESSSSIPADRIWKFDGSTLVGKNWLAILLSAKASDQPIQFYEIENYSLEGGMYFWKVDGITLGGN